jgi:predicted ATPase
MGLADDSPGGVHEGAEIRPLILVVEDLHWMDESSEDVFQDLLEHIAGARVLLIFTYRPEYIHTWGQRSYHGHVHVNRLSGRGSSERHPVALLRPL